MKVVSRGLPWSDQKIADVLKVVQRWSLKMEIRTFESKLETFDCSLYA